MRTYTKIDLPDAELLQVPLHPYNGSDAKIHILNYPYTHKIPWARQAVKAAQQQGAHAVSLITMGSAGPAALHAATTAGMPMVHLLDAQQFKRMYGDAGTDYIVRQLGTKQNPIPYLCASIDLSTRRTKADLEARATQILAKKEVLAVLKTTQHSPTIDITNYHDLVQTDRSPLVFPEELCKQYQLIIAPLGTGNLALSIFDAIQKHKTRDQKTQDPQPKVLLVAPEGHAIYGPSHRQNHSPAYHAFTPYLNSTLEHLIKKTNQTDLTFFAPKNRDIEQAAGIANTLLDEQYQTNQVRDLYTDGKNTHTEFNSTLPPQRKLTNTAALPLTILPHLGRKSIRLRNTTNQALRQATEKTTYAITDPTTILFVTTGHPKSWEQVGQELSRKVA